MASSPRARYGDITAAAAYLGMTEKAVRRKVERGQIPHIRIDGRIRFDFTDLDLWMRRHRIEANAS